MKQTSCNSLFGGKGKSRLSLRKADLYRLISTYRADAGDKVAKQCAFYVGTARKLFPNPPFTAISERADTEKYFLALRIS